MTPLDEYCRKMSELVQCRGILYCTRDIWK